MTAQVSSRPATNLLDEHDVAVRPVSARQLLRGVGVVGVDDEDADRGAPPLTGLMT